MGALSTRLGAQGASGRWGAQQVPGAHRQVPARQASGSGCGRVG